MHLLPIRLTKTHLNKHTTLKSGKDGTMNNSIYYKATDEDGNTILRHAFKNKKYRNGWKQNLEDGAARKKNDWKRELDFRAKINADKKAEAEKKKEIQKAKEDYIKANRLKKVRKVIKEVKRLTKPGTPYKGPTSAHQAQQIKKEEERQKLVKKLRNQQAREDYVRANRRKKVQKVVGEVKKFTKPGTPYKGPTSAYQAQQIQKDKERQKLAKELKNRKIAKQNRESREKAANINRRKKAGKAYLNNLTK